MVIVGNCGNPPNVKVWATSQDARATWIEMVEESSRTRYPRIGDLVQSSVTHGTNRPHPVRRG